MRRAGWLSLLVVTVAGLLAGGLSLGATSTPSRAGRSASVWISTMGGACRRAHHPGGFVAGDACGSFQAALDAARAGDTVLVRCASAAACSFAPETLSSFKGSPGRRITVAAAPGDSVTFDPETGSGVPVWLNELHNVNFVNIAFGHNDVGANGGFGSNLRIDCSSSITLVNSSGRRFHLFEGDAGITFAGGSWGGYNRPGEEDSGIGTTEANGPSTVCRGDRSPKPASYITFSGIAWHDVFAGTSSSEWGSSHPDCFEINGYTNHVTIRDSRFYNCGNTFFSLYGNQGFNYNLVFEHNHLYNLNDNPASQEYYAVQIHSDPNAASTPGAGVCGNVVLRGNDFEPRNPHAPGPYSGLLIECTVASGYRPVQVYGNVFNVIEPSTVCRQSRSGPTRVQWGRNRWRRGPACR